MIAQHRIDTPHRSYDPLLDQRRRKRLSPGAVAGIVISVIVHVGLLGWLWEAKFQPHYQAPEEPAPVEVGLANLAPPPTPPPPPQRLTVTRSPPPITPRPTITSPQNTVEASPLKPIDTPHVETITPPQAGPTAPSNTVAPQPASPPVLSAADFTVRPTSDDLQGLYPEGAQRDGVGGKVQMQCVVTERGSLTACRILSETPAGLGFGTSTLKAARLFKMHPASVNGKAVQAQVVFPLVWQPASE